jgi:Uma2 family endonuclease
MDPYLEARDLWEGVHQWLATHIARDLQPQLRPHYVAMVERRVFLSPVDEDFRPDALVLEQTAHSLSLLPLDYGGGVAVAERTAPVEIAQPERIALPDWEIRQPYIEIRDARNRKVVTVIEVLSPWNKTPGRGQDDYLDKQEEVLLSDANLVEIDLLREGRHTIAAPVSRMGPSDYRLCLHRVEHPRAFEVFRLSLREPLPNVGIPLRPREPDVVLHLQEVLTRCYDDGAYDLVIDYTEEPDPPLPPEEAAWADALLREHGLRGAGEGQRP